MLLPGREIPGTELCLEKYFKVAGPLDLWRRFPALLLAFIFEKDIKYDKKIFILPPASARSCRTTGRAGQDPQLARREMDRVTIPISVGQGAVKPTTQKHKGHAHRERAVQERSLTTALECRGSLGPLSSPAPHCHVHHYESHHVSSSSKVSISPTAAWILSQKQHPCSHQEVGRSTVDTGRKKKELINILFFGTV